MPPAGREGKVARLHGAKLQKHCAVLGNVLLTELGVGHFDSMRRIISINYTYSAMSTSNNFINQGITIVKEAIDVSQHEQSTNYSLFVSFSASSNDALSHC